jgi:hypothetical protein
MRLLAALQKEELIKSIRINQDLIAFRSILGCLIFLTFSETKPEKNSDIHILEPAKIEFKRF